MTKSPRLKLGLSLLAIAGVGFISMVAADLIWGHPQLVATGSGSTGDGGYWADSEFKTDSVVSGFCLIPIILCGVIGVLCLAWPSRKPPKLKR